MTPLRAFRLGASGTEVAVQVDCPPAYAFLCGFERLVDFVVPLPHRTLARLSVRELGDLADYETAGRSTGNKASSVLLVIL